MNAESLADAAVAERGNPSPHRLPYAFAKRHGVLAL
jgi:hypothetical protein